MWMQLGSRAFFAGANQRIQKHEDEPKRPSLYLGGLPTLRLFNTNSLSQVYVPHYYFGHQICATCETDNNVEERCSASKSNDYILLSNPTMNELMETIQANSTPDLNHLIVVGGNTKGAQRLLMTKGESSESLNDLPCHRAYSADDINQLNDCSSRHSLLLRIRSEGTLVPLPGIDSSLSKQMAMLKPHYDDCCTESAISLITAELEGGIIDGPSDGSCGDCINDNHKYMGLIPCTCCLCLGHEANMANGIEYQVNEALLLIEEAVQAARQMERRTPSSELASATASPASLGKNLAKSVNLGTTLYFISLAHLLLVIACLRGIF